MHRRIRKRCIAIFLSLVIILGLLPGMGQQVKAASVTAPTMNGADGSQLNPYIIDEPDDLLWIASEVNTTTSTNTFKGKYFLQTADIDMTGKSWTPIGFDPGYMVTASNIFGGIYDGNGHTISNVNVNSPGTLDYLGFFGSTTENSEIKNLSISNITINYTAGNTNTKGIGLIVGNSKSIITNCHVTGSISATVSTDCNMLLGGIVGFSSKAISKCSSAVSITSNNGSAEMGGIAGSQSANIDDCAFSGTISNTAATPLNGIGGIAGHMSGGTVKHCYARGTLATTASQKGGIVGIYSSGTTSADDNNYYLSGIASNGYASLGSGLSNIGTAAKTDAELKNSANYSGWDFTTVWKNDTDGTTYPYPRSKANLTTLDINTSNPSSVIVSCNISSDGGDTVISRGAEYCLIGDTTFTKVAAPDGGTGAFTINLTGLPVGGYYIRAYATNSLGTVIGNTAEFFNAPTGGGVSSSDPYIVDSDEDLNYIRYDTDAYYRLDYDLDLTTSAFHNWTPIGNINNPFIGTFEGNGHMISGYIASALVGGDGNIYSGLFGTIGIGGTVTHLGVNGAVNCAGYSGSGINFSCSGGIASYNKGTISECYNMADLSDTYYCLAVGGIAGCNEGTIENCYNTGDISSYPSDSTRLDDNGYAGGIVGYDFGTSMVSKSYNSGNIYAGGYSSSSAGICGYADSDNSKIENCFSTGTISGGTAPKLGGISTIAGKPTNCDFVAQSGLTLDGTAGGATGEGSSTYFTASTGGAYNNFYTAAGWDFTSTWKFVSSGYPSLKAFVPVVSAVISTSSGITENNLNGRQITVTLKNTAFKASLDKQYFTLSGVPAGTSVASVTRTSDTVCTVALNYDNTDFDSNKSISLTISASQLDSGAELTTNSLSIIATVELAPTVSGILPQSGPIAGGSTVTITGANFADVSAVYFGSTAASSVNIASSTSITATAPSGTGTVDVTVVTRGGTSAINASDSFKYYAVPNITNVAPNNGPLAGSSVTITGTGFTDASVVKFSTTNAVFTVVSDTEITATAPAGTAGTVNITVITPGGASTTSSHSQYTYVAPPTVTISSTAGSLTNASPIPITVTFSKSVTGFTSGDITVSGGTLGDFSGSGTTYTANITPSGQGAVTADIAAGVATDAVGNGNTAAVQLSRTYDSVAPTVIITSTAGNPTKSSPIPITITFSESVTGFTSGDITVNGGTLGSFSGSGTTYTANITPSGQGSVTADIAASAATDSAGNNSAAATQFSRIYDTTAPTVTITSTAGNPTKVSPIPITIIFSKSVTGFTEGDIVVSGGTLGSFSGSGTTYSASITPSGQGLITADVASDVALDAAGNGNAAAAQLSRTFDTVAPTAIITSATGSPTKASPIPITITFSEGVTGFVASDITVSGGTLGDFSGSGTTYSASITPSGQGLVTADVAAGVATDSAGNVNSAATQFSRTYDSVAPTVTITSTAGETTSTSPIPITIVFNESVTGFTEGDITVSGGTLGNFSGSGTTYTASITPSGQGTVTADIAAGAATDAAGNGNTAATQLSRTYDSVEPTVTISSAAGSLTNVSPIPITVTFSKSVTGFTSGDITVSGGTLGDFSGSGKTYTASITPSGQGVVTADIAAGVATDAGGNGNAAAAQLSRTYDSVAPTVTITSTTGNPTKSSPIPITITFSENVTGFTSGDITVNGGTLGSFSGSGTTYTASITPSGQGSVTADIAASAATDTAGNDSTAATQFSRTYDSTAPTVTITSTAGSTTNVSPIPITITFSENVTGFTEGDIIVSGGTLGSFSGSGTTYSASITPSGQGLVTADVTAGVALDAAGNGNASATQLSRTFDTVAPTATITSATVSPTKASPIPITITFSEGVTGFVASDITVSGGTLGNFSGSGTTYTASITPSGQGLVTADVAAGVAADSAGNVNTAATQFSRTYDSVAPTVTITSTAGDTTGTSPIPITIVFSESVTGFTSSDVIVSGGTLGNFSGSGSTYTAEVTPSRNGVITVNIAGGVAQDTAGNNNIAAAQVSRTYNGIALTTSITSTGSSFNSSSIIPITVTFNEGVTGFTASDIMVTGGVLSNFSGSGETYTADITPDGHSTVTVDVLADVAKDVVNNGNASATLSLAIHLSNDATLSGIKLDGVSIIGFSANTDTYSIELPYGTMPGSAAATLGATTHFSHASVLINQVSTLPGDATVIVTAEDKTTVKTYTVHLTLGAQPYVAPSEPEVPKDQKKDQDSAAPTEVGGNAQGWSAITDNIEQLITKKDAKSDVKDDSKSDPKSDPKSDSKGDSKSESESDTKNTIITINTNEATVIPQKLFETIKGQDITVKLVIAEGIEWSIKGQDVTGTDTDKDLSGIDMNVDLGVHNIPEALIEELPVSDESAVQLSIAHDGNLGFTATLTINLDKQNSGKTANLYYYNPITKQLELQAVGRIDEKGNTQFDFGHASDYVIITDNGETLKQQMEQLSVAPSKKVLYLGGNKDKTTKLSIVLPKTLKTAIENGSSNYTVSYTSANPKIVTVSSKGKITAKMTGTTTITTVITIDGVKKSYRTKITVKKR